MCGFTGARELVARGLSVIPLDHPDNTWVTNPDDIGKTATIKWKALQKALPRSWRWTRPRLQYLLQAPYCGRAAVTTFMRKFRQAFPDVRVAPAADFVAEGDYVVGRWVGSGTHTGPAYCDFLVGCLPSASGQQMRFMGTTVLRVQNGKIAEQIGLDDEVTASLQLGLTGAAW